MDLKQQLEEKLRSYKETWRGMKPHEKFFLVALMIVGIGMIMVGTSMVLNA